MDEDFILRQIRAVSEGIGKLLKKQSSEKVLQEIQKENHLLATEIDAAITYLEMHQITEAVTVVNRLKYKMSAHDFQNISYWFMEKLKTYQYENSEKLTLEDLESHRSTLYDLL